MRDPFLGDPIVLREVTDGFAEKGRRKLSVIIGVRRGFAVKDVVAKLRSMGVEGIKTTDHYVSADLSKTEVGKIAGTGMVHKVWRNREMKPMVDESRNTVNASAALQLFGASGQGITWAVLDTGIKGDHDYFKDEPAVVKKPQFNFTDEPHEDLVGHGTHVAGIIRKLAPKTTIHDIKVLGKDGGTSFGIIEAMYQIRRMNTEARELIIHGANLSLGGPVPVGSYGCGFSPECQEADRLMESGVVVCVAASNDGYKTLAAISGDNNLEYYPTFLDMGISDPGNAEKVITVGSTHKTSPHKYGISYFSSKGPTGDGRFKPDVVAPGEDIKSAGIVDTREEVTSSGTSMATPHVSAAVAQFLSVKREFVGHAEEVKQIMMKNCTDLGRDRNFQGAGLINVLRMIEAV